MRRSRPKENKTKRGREEREHWLGEGVLGIETLFDDLEPHLFALDKAICNAVTSKGLEYDGIQSHPLLLLILPEESVNWQISFLSRDFAVWLWANIEDEILQQAIDCFGIDAFSGAVPSALEGNVDLFLSLQLSWNDELTFIASVKEAQGLLSEFGSAMFVLPGYEEDGIDYVSWSQADSSELQPLLSPRPFGLSIQGSCLKESLEDVTPISDDVVTFLKRHREFFGRDALDICRARMRQDDFIDGTKGGEGRRKMAYLLQWQFSSSEKFL